jgi:hypothetical protein
MKKLLLVMLVPVLVLGVMSCGAKIPNGDPVPTSLQGNYNVSIVTTITKAYLVGNQLTIDRNTSDPNGKMLFRINYEGPTQDEDGYVPASTSTATPPWNFKLTLYEYDSKYTEIGTLLCNNAAECNETAAVFIITGIEYPDERTYYTNLLNQLFGDGTQVWTRSIL